MPAECAARLACLGEKKKRFGGKRVARFPSADRSLGKQWIREGKSGSINEASQEGH